MNRPALTIRQLFRDTQKKLKLELLTSAEGLKKEITESELHRPGLALAGFLELFTYHRVQILGNTEIRYLKTLDDRQRKEALEKVLQFDIPCIFITESNEVPQDLIDIANQHHICVFRSSYATTIFSHFLSDYLHQIFAPVTTIHGTLVDVYGIGMLFTGRSGIGKSEIALDLVERGHRLVADDLVVITKKAEDILMGEGRDPTEFIMEIRGVGLIDIRHIFGIRSVRVHKRIEVVVKLVEFDPNEDYDRTGLDALTTNILGVDLDLVILPIHPGKNITVIAETIAMNQQLKIYGHHTPTEFNKRLIEKMKLREKEHLERLKARDFLDKDFE
ncbi:MAG: HPr kinase/phosphorylase [Calditrichaceae bacterium]|nr:HPr(Ser) kinase/phosphatase [Calditrichia bacterium]NUQ43848.1 HPr kinase/phosphorylase [Calditrichaceae bacterium]